MRSKLRVWPRGNELIKPGHDLQVSGLALSSGPVRLERGRLCRFARICRPERIKIHLPYVEFRGRRSDSHNLIPGKLERQHGIDANNFFGRFHVVTA